MVVCMVEITKEENKKVEKNIDVEFPRYVSNYYGERATHERHKKVECIEKDNENKLKVITVEYDSDDGYTINIEEKSTDLGINFKYYIGRDNSQNHNKDNFLRRFKEAKQLFNKIEDNILDEDLMGE